MRQISTIGFHSPQRIKTDQSQEGRDAVYNMKDKETTNSSFESENVIPVESKYQIDTKRRPGRLGPNPRTTISRRDFDQKKSRKVGSFPFKCRLINLLDNLSASGKLKPGLIENEVNEADQRPTLHKSKSVQIQKIIPSNSMRSVTTSVTSTSYSVTGSETDNKKETGKEKRKDEHKSQLQSRRRIGPRITNRGHALAKDSYKANEFMKNNLRVNNVTESKKKVEQPVPRLTESKLKTY